jgi:CubicO group peptidase (beta-lactamase class C family)
VTPIASSFPDRYAEALGALPLGEAEIDAVLDLARTVAHATERRYAPLSTYLAGRYVAERAAAGVPLADALAEAVALAQAESRSTPRPDPL